MMRLRTTLGILLATALVLAIVPGPASADHLDEEGDTVTIDYVQTETLSICQRAVNPTVYIGPVIQDPGLEETQEDTAREVRQASPQQPHVVNPLVYDEVCFYPPVGTYELTVEGEDGEPAQYSWSIVREYGYCTYPKTSQGSVQLSYPSNPFCQDLNVDVADSAPTTGTITLERIE